MDESVPWVRVGSGVSRENIRHHTAPMTAPEHMLHKADFVKRYETYMQDLQCLLDAISAEGKIDRDSCPRLRITQHRTWETELSDSLRNELADFYKNDFETLNYSPIAGETCDEYTD